MFFYYYEARNTSRSKEGGKLSVHFGSIATFLFSWNSTVCAGKWAGKCVCVCVCHIVGASLHLRVRSIWEHWQHADAGRWAGPFHGLHRVVSEHHLAMHSATTLCCYTWLHSCCQLADERPCRIPQQQGIAVKAISSNLPLTFFSFRFPQFEIQKFECM